MRYTKLPSTDIEVSVLAMGCWALSGDSTWGRQEERQSLDAVRAALDAGINFFDTAPMYGDGLSERRLGRGLGVQRDRAVIATKLRPEAMTPDRVVASCEQSLRDLGTDHIDLLQVHWPSRDVPIERTWGAMRKLREQGKARALGVCNFGVGDLGELLEIEAPVSDQLPYSLLSRSIEHEVLPLCRRRGVGVLCYSPLMLGLLADKYMDADEVPAGRARTRHFSGDRPQARHGEAGREVETFEALGRIRAICRDLGQPMSDVALAWLLHQPGVSAVLAGIRKPAQAARNAAAVDLPLRAETLTALAEATDTLKEALGPNPDLWQAAAESRYR